MRMLHRATTLVFDVEGTLVDCVPQTLHCWQQTLQDFGHPVELRALQAYSGLDGREMLNRLLPHEPTEKKTQILKAQGNRYRRECIGMVQAFSGVRELFEALRREGYRLAIATTCQKDELDRYDELMKVRKLCEVIVCGSDVRRGKPHPDLFRVVLNKLGLHQHSEALAIGDTPYDSMAAIATGMRSMGVLTGGFSEVELKQAGCASILPYVSELRNVLIAGGTGESAAR
jgi:HAD superfamily hydrolase (TIGR01509 family)